MFVALFIYNALTIGHDNKTTMKNPFNIQVPNSYIFVYLQRFLPRLRGEFMQLCAEQCCLVDLLSIISGKEVYIVFFNNYFPQRT